MTTHVSVQAVNGGVLDDVGTFTQNVNVYTTYDPNDSDGPVYLKVIDASGLAQKVLFEKYYNQAVQVNITRN